MPLLSRTLINTWFILGAFIVGGSLAECRVVQANATYAAFGKLLDDSMLQLQFEQGCTVAQAVAGAADRARIVELEAELERAKGREEGLQYALQRAYGCTCMKLSSNFQHHIYNQ